MALRQVRIGSLENVHQYDDGDYDKSIEVEDPIKCTAPPVAGTDVVRLEDIGVLYPVAVADLDNPTELASAIGTDGMLVLAYKAVGPAGLNEYTLYAYDSSGPAVSSPYIVDALGVGNERWIAIGGKYRIFTTMYTLGTKDPPIDADKVIYRNSAAADVLVTSTWTQIKAFLKTYFDTLYGTLGSSHARAHTINSSVDHTDTSLAAISNNDLMQWDDPSSKWEPKSIQEVVLAQALNPGSVTIGSKGRLTVEGGFAVKLTNKTGGDSVKGEVVTSYAASAINNAVAKIIVDVPDPIGVFYESGVADGDDAWVVVSGIADVYFVGSTTLGHIARGFLTADGASYVTGQAMSEAIPGSPFSVDKHFYEIGHVLEARVGAGLAKCVLHFN